MIAESRLAGLEWRPVDGIPPAVELAWDLAGRHPALDTRDLVHLACCLRREPREVVTFDRALAAAWEARG